jgi:hypothetical protein
MGQFKVRMIWMQLLKHAKVETTMFTKHMVPTGLIGAEAEIPGVAHNR